MDLLNAIKIIGILAGFLVLYDLMGVLLGVSIGLPRWCFLKGRLRIVKKTTKYSRGNLEYIVYILKAKSIFFGRWLETDRCLDQQVIEDKYNERLGGYKKNTVVKKSEIIKAAEEQDKYFDAGDEFISKTIEDFKNKQDKK